MPQTQSSSSRKILVILALSLFIIALILMIVSSMTQKSPISLKQNPSFADGYRVAREQATNMGFPGITDALPILSGSVTKIQDGTITIETQVFVNKAVDGVGTERYIRLAEGGKVFLRKDKDFGKLEKEMQAFHERMRNLELGEEPIEPPVPFEDTEVSLSDISVDDLLYAEEDGKDDLRLEETINATSIIVFKSQKPLLPEPQLIPESEPESES